MHNQMASSKLATNIKKKLKKKEEAETFSQHFQRLEALLRAYIDVPNN